MKNYFHINGVTVIRQCVSQSVPSRQKKTRSICTNQLGPDRQWGWYVAVNLIYSSKQINIPFPILPPSVRGVDKHVWKTACTTWIQFTHTHPWSQWDALSQIVRRNLEQQFVSMYVLPAHEIIHLFVIRNGITMRRGTHEKLIW